MARTRFIHVALFALTALAPAAAPAADAEPPRAVSVGAEGEVRVRPDRARLSMGVELLNADLRVAESEVNRIVRAFLAEARNLGAREELVSTTAANVQPEYVWPKPGQERRLSGYRVGRRIELTVENLDKLGDFLMAATRAGLNQVSPPELQHSRAAELEQEALALAARRAEAKARRLAETLGVKLGHVRRIDATASEAPPIPFKAMAMRAEADAGGDMGLSAGEIVIRAAVTAEFDLALP